MQRMGYIVQTRYLTESRRLVEDGRCSCPTSPTSFTLNITGMIIVSADVRSPLPEQLLNDSIEWLNKNVSNTEWYHGIFRLCSS